MRRAPRTSGGGRRPAPGNGAGRAIAAALCAAVIACAGCGAATAPAAIVSQDAGSGVTARLSLSPAPAPVMKPVRLSVALTGAGGRPVAGRAVTFDLSMTAMAMPANRPQVTETSNGLYQATTLLSMAGEWRLTVAIGGSGPPQTIPFTFSAQ
jgi:hypothetical protein